LPPGAGRAPDRRRMASRGSCPGPAPGPLICHAGRAGVHDRAALDDRSAGRTEGEMACQFLAMERACVQIVRWRAGRSGEGVRPYGTRVYGPPGREGLAVTCPAGPGWLPPCWPCGPRAGPARSCIAPRLYGCEVTGPQVATGSIYAPSPLRHPGAARDFTNSGGPLRAPNTMRGLVRRRQQRRYPGSLLHLQAGVRGWRTRREAIPVGRIWLYLVSPD
jgi:hypothetical protein